MSRRKGLSLQKLKLLISDPPGYCRSGAGITLKGIREGGNDFNGKMLKSFDRLYLLSRKGIDGLDSSITRGKPGFVHIAAL